MKKISRRDFLALTAAVGTAGVLTACSGSSSAAASTASSSSAASTEPAAAGDADPFADAAVIRIQFAENQSSASELGIAAEKFKTELEEATNGTLQLDLYFDALLGDEASVIGMIEAGAVEFSRVNLAALQATAPEVGVLTLPYMYSDAVQCDAVLNGEIGQEILDSIASHGFQGLRMSGGHPTQTDGALSRGFYAGFPITCVADLAGKKVRVQESEIVIKMCDALGCVATPMAYGEVFQALQTGVVDAAENDPYSYYSSGHYEVAKYYTNDAHQISPSMYIMSQNCWDQMNDAQREAFLTALDNYLTETADSTYTMIAEAKQAAIDSGCEFIDVDTTEFQTACQPVYDMFPEYAEMVERIKAVKA